MTILQQYSPPGAPWVDPQTGLLTMSASVWLRDLWMRVGGATAPTNTDLAAVEYADAGIEELKAAVYVMRTDLESALTANRELAELVAEQAKRIEALEQGVEV